MVSCAQSIFTDKLNNKNPVRVETGVIQLPKPPILCIAINLSELKSCVHTKGESSAKQAEQNYRLSTVSNELLREGERDNCPESGHVLFGPSAKGML